MLDFQHHTDPSDLPATDTYLVGTGRGDFIFSGGIPFPGEITIPIASEKDSLRLKWNAGNWTFTMDVTGANAPIEARVDEIARLSDSGSVLETFGPFEYQALVGPPPTLLTFGPYPITWTGGQVTDRVRVTWRLKNTLAGLRSVSFFDWVATALVIDEFGVQADGFELLPPVQTEGGFTVDAPVLAVDFDVDSPVAILGFDVCSPVEATFLLEVC
jgi:hypothetical protein